jgi:RHS repeat-associated protein
MMITQRDINKIQTFIFTQRLIAYLLVLKYGQLLKTIAENQSSNLIEEADESSKIKGLRPFGETITITGTVMNNLRFPGQYYDAETGSHQNWYRDYKPEIGRYLEADPIGLLGGVNLFTYVGNNPVNKKDPSGLIIAIPVGIAACMANPACASAVLAGGAATAAMLSKWIETIEVPSEPMPTPDLSNIPERCRIEYEICKKAADQAECGEVKRTAKKAWCWTKFLVCLAGSALQ